MTKHRFDSIRPKREGPSHFMPGTNASNSAEHHFRIAQWALLRGGTFTARDLHEHFGISETTSRRYAKAWAAVFGGRPPTIRRGKAEPAPVKLSLDELLKG